MKDLSYYDRLKRLNLMSLQRRRERYILIHTWKIINNFCPNDIGLEVNRNQRLGIKLYYPILIRRVQPLQQPQYTIIRSVLRQYSYGIFCQGISTQQLPFRLSSPNLGPSSKGFLTILRQLDIQQPTIIL